MGWDRGIDYEYAYNVLVRSLKTRNNRARVRKCYSAILLIQLRNGLRISEAIRAFKQFMTTRKAELSVNVSKKKKPEARLVVIPIEVVETQLDECVELVSIDDNVLKNRICAYAIQVFKFNTHSLRYAFITRLLKEGVSPSIISKITRHSKLDFILTYTQERVAEEVLKKLD